MGATTTGQRSGSRHSQTRRKDQPGDRRRYFRVSLSRWKQGLEQKIEDSAAFAQLLRETRAAFGRRHPEHRATLLQLIEFERLFQEKMSEVIETFQRRNPRRP